jgi:hypothetical protein
LFAEKFCAAFLSLTDIFLKGIASPDFVVCFLVSYDRSEVERTCGVYLFIWFKTSISGQILWFSRLGVVSLPCEFSWAIRLSVATVVAPYGAHYGSHANVALAENFWRWKVSQSGAHCSPVSFRSSHRFPM